MLANVVAFYLLKNHRTNWSQKVQIETKKFIHIQVWSTLVKKVLRKKSAEKERSNSSKKKSKKKVLDSKKKTDIEEETKAQTIEMRLLGLRVVIKGKNYCV